MEYVTPERRTTRKDLKRKELFNNRYKKGGSYRTLKRKEKEAYETNKKDQF